MRTFRAVNTGNTILDRMLSAIESALGSLAGAVTNDRLVTVAIGTSDTPVTHGLGHPVRTWEVVDRDANAVVWRPPTTVNNRPAQVLILRASAAVNVKLRLS